MFQTDFYKEPSVHRKRRLVEFTSDVSPSEIEYAYFTHWEEHCVECSAPACFSTCALYTKRRDGMCARFHNGIYPNRSFLGPLGYGADIHFKRWGKLQTDLKYRALPLPSYFRLVGLDEAVLKFVRPIAGLFNPIIPVRKVNSHTVHNFFRNKFLDHYFGRHGDPSRTYDALLVEGYNPSQQTVRLNLEIRQQHTTKYRNSLSFAPGPNLHRLPYSSFNVDLTQPPQDGDTFIIYPEDDAEVRIIFTWLHFVKFAAKPTVSAVAGSSLPGTQPIGSIDKVKCVIWDLDNTIWAGILVEDGADRLRLRENVVETITELDRRGILQSIVSKNDHDFAWELVKRFGLDKFFLHPQISWRPKSEGIQRIAAELNLNANSFALIDDSAFERGEVKSTFPQVRVYTEEQIKGLTGLPEFEVPLTEESGKRREMYMHEAARKKVADSPGRIRVLETQRGGCGGLRSLVPGR
jgi:HAD superfamily phosphatase (TIGR01681 family)